MATSRRPSPRSTISGFSDLLRNPGTTPNCRSRWPWRCKPVRCNAKTSVWRTRFVCSAASCRSRMRDCVNSRRNVRASHASSAMMPVQSCWTSITCKREAGLCLAARDLRHPHRLTERLAQVVIVPGLGQESINRSTVDGLGYCAQVCIAAQDQADRVRMRGFDPAQELGSLAFRHAVVRHYHVHIFGAQDLERILE